MKKCIIMLILATMVLSFSGCASKKGIDEKENVKQETVEKDDKSEEQTEEEDQKPEDTSEGEIEIPKEKISVNVYRPGEDGETLETEVKECEELNENILWELLKETTSIPKESVVNSLKVDGDKLELDVDQLFGEELRSYGTSGENALMGCVVNTYLEAYKVSSIKITEEGQVLCSGHREYADYLTRY